jgi:uncharacterized protein with ParB-like and HNH nuclease domain
LPRLLVMHIEELLNKEMCKENFVRSYSLREIASWQRDIGLSFNINDDFQITLPSLQRGFVWKPNQIESLWDSILRGYPIGAVLMSQTERVKELLDGQQRSTSIALGFTNPFQLKENIEIFNLKKNLPVIWIDLKPVLESKYGLKYGVRVLTRSHPWGYQLSDHRQTLSTSEREKALNYFRDRHGDKSINFSVIPNSIVSPWDVHYPIPLYALLAANHGDFSSWKSEVKSFIKTHLKNIKTRYTKNEAFVNYDDLTDIEFEFLYKGIVKANQLNIPEILVHKETLEEEDNTEESGDATLFVRLNSEGTRISGEELIYSLFKATFPEAKELVEDIGIKYISPSKLVNLFARLSLIEVFKFSGFQKEMNVVTFRKNYNDEHFRNYLQNYIKKGSSGNSVGQALMARVESVLTHNPQLPKIFIKEIVNKSTDLILVLLAYLRKKENLSNSEKSQVHKDFFAVALFSKDIKDSAKELFNQLLRLEFTNWSVACENVRNNHCIMYPMISPENFKSFHLKHIIPKLLQIRKGLFTDNDFLKNLISNNKEDVMFLLKEIERPVGMSDEDFVEKRLNIATELWKGTSGIVYWNKSLLILAQREYFNREFNEFMEFDGIQDTNRPWDWDHIYPSSWVHSRWGIVDLVKRTVDTNGNFRSLSFNENRSQSNHQSPNKRFKDNPQAQRDSFVKDNDIEYWMQLTNDDTRLTEAAGNFNPKVDAFIYASFMRMFNLYFEVYFLFGNPLDNKPKI